MVRRGGNLLGLLAVFSASRQLLLGIAFARAAPVLLGLHVAQMLTLDAYFSFVRFIVVSNLVSAVPLLGGSTLLLSGDPNQLSRGALRQVVASTAAIHFLAFLIIAPLSQGQIDSSAEELRWQILLPLSVYTYSLGYCALGLSAAVLNRLGNHEAAGGVWFKSSALVIAVGGTSTYLSSSLFVSLLAFSLSCACAGIVALLMVCRHISKKAAFSPKSHSKEHLRQSLVAGLPSVLLAAGFLAAMQQAGYDVSSTARAAFSLGFQLFSITIFIPGALGGVVTPKAADIARTDSGRSQATKTIFLSYLLLSVAIAAGILLCLPLLISVYKIPEEGTAVTIIAILQGTSILAAGCAAFNQMAAARRAFGLLLAMSSAWLLASLLGVALVGLCAARHAALGSALALLAAYGVSLIIGWCLLGRR